MTDAEKLRGFREKVGWTQATMAGCLGIERSYLSQLESGTRPIKEWVIKKAEEIHLEAERLGARNVHKSEQVNISGEPLNFRSYAHNDLIELYAHIVQQRNSAPSVAQGIYKLLSSDIQKELARRLNITPNVVD